MDMSFDHKPTDQIELDRITKAGGKVGADSRVNGGLNLSRAIGTCSIFPVAGWTDFVAAKCYWVCSLKFQMF